MSNPETDFRIKTDVVTLTLIAYDSRPIQVDTTRVIAIVLVLLMVTTNPTPPCSGASQHLPRSLSMLAQASQLPTGGLVLH